VNRMRVAVHVHTEWSFDATWPLSRVARAFGRRGYDAVLTSEHSQSLDANAWGRYRKACAEVSSESGVLLVPGVEYRDSTNTVHVSVWGDVPFFHDGLDVQNLLERVSQTGGVAVLAHPGRRDAHKMVDPAWAPLLGGVEVWNRKYDGWCPGKSALGLASELRLPVFVSLDFHGRRQFFPLSMRLDWDWPPSERAICDALRNGRLEPKVGYLPARALISGPAFRCLTMLEKARKRVAPLLRRRGSRLVS